MFVELALVVSFIVGLAVLLSNPSRTVNRLFALLLGLLVIWLTSVLIAFKIPNATYFGIDFFWRRLNASITVSLPAILGIITYFISHPRASWNNTIWRYAAWATYVVIGLLIPIVHSFIYIDSGNGSLKRGLPYVIHCVYLMIGCIIVILSSHIAQQSCGGMKKIELRYIVSNIAYVVLLGVIAIWLGNIINIPQIKHIAYFALILSVGMAGWVIVFHRIVDTSQLLPSIGHAAITALLLAAGSFILWIGFQRASASFAEVWIGFILLCCAMLWINHQTRRFLKSDSDSILRRVKKAVLDIAQREPNVIHAKPQFESLIIDEFKVRSAEILLQNGDRYVGDSISIDIESPAYISVCERGWETVETLDRSRRRPGLPDLNEILKERNLEAIISSSQGSYKPGLLLIIGRKINEWPFSYPEIERLQCLAELIDNILVHSKLTTQLALQTKIEHLAIVSRGLAHDLKNLIIPISTFLLHSHDRFCPGSDEEAVYEAAQHSVQTMDDYVKGTLFFAEQLSLQISAINSVSLLHKVRETTADRAKRKKVLVEIETLPTEFEGDSILLQRLFANLVNNAIDASSCGTKIRLVTMLPKQNAIRFEVADTGGGIAQENLSRVFDPFFTTKSLGDETRGFGLGLTICQKIVQLHGGTIRLQSSLGRGTIVTVEIPISRSKPGYLA